MSEAVGLEEKEKILSYAYDLLKQHGQVVHYSTLLDEVTAKFFADREDQVQVKVRFYTWLNLDSRFASIGQGYWGLRTAVPQKGGRQVPLLTLMHKSVEYDDSPTRAQVREPMEDDALADKELLEDEAVSEDEDEFEDEVEQFEE